MASNPPGPETGWGVQFYRRSFAAGSLWVAHGSRDIYGPDYSRLVTVNAGAWDTRAVWTRTGSVTVEMFKTVECR